MEEPNRPAANSGAGERDRGNQDEALVGCRIGALAERKKDKSRKDQRIRERNYVQEVGILEFESAGRVRGVPHQLRPRWIPASRKSVLFSSVFVSIRCACSFPEAVQTGLTFSPNQSDEEIASGIYNNFVSFTRRRVTFPVLQRQDASDQPAATLALRCQWPRGLRRLPGRTRISRQERIHATGGPPVLANVT